MATVTPWGADPTMLPLLAVAAAQWGGGQIRPRFPSRRQRWHRGRLIRPCPPPRNDGGGIGAADPTSGDGGDARGAGLPLDDSGGRMGLRGPVGTLATDDGDGRSVAPSL